MCFPLLRTSGSSAAPYLLASHLLVVGEEGSTEWWSS